MNMRKHVLLLYARDLSMCRSYSRIFDSEFELITTGTERDFLESLRTRMASAAVLCWCSSDDETMNDLERLEAFAGPIPIVVCLATYDPDFIRRAGERGVNHFLLCTMDVGDIRAYIHKTIRSGGLRSFLRACAHTDLDHSPYVSKIIREIVQVFPHRWRVRDLSQKLGISPRRLQMICREAFGKPFTQLTRCIWVYQALKLMQSTELSNGEIALRLDYSEETSFARAFRKELGFNPSEARRRLAHRRPEDLLMH
jgi:AraC-like DNA-binding protein